MGEICAILIMPLHAQESQPSASSIPASASADRAQAPDRRVDAGHVVVPGSGAAHFRSDPDIRSERTKSWHARESAKHGQRQGPRAVGLLPLSPDVQLSQDSVHLHARARHNPTCMSTQTHTLSSPSSSVHQRGERVQGLRGEGAGLQISFIVPRETIAVQGLGGEGRGARGE
eukprot:3941156-Rhodomonas_salina.1